MALIHRKTKLLAFQYFALGPDEETADLGGWVMPPDGDTEAVDRDTTDPDVGADADADRGRADTGGTAPDCETDLGEGNTGPDSGGTDLRGGGTQHAGGMDVRGGSTGEGAVPDPDPEVAGQALRFIDFVTAARDPAEGVTGPGRGVADPKGGIGKDDDIGNIEREAKFDGGSDRQGTAAEGGAIDPNRG